MVSERSLEVLRVIVQDYVASHEPVGSKAIVERHSFGVSAATIRNDMAQLEEEGVMQVLTLHEGLRSEPILAVVGELQFDVLRSRLENEYDVETSLQELPYKLARWVDRDPSAVAAMTLPSRSRVAVDSAGRAVVLFSSDWELEYAEKENPDVEFRSAS